MKRYLLSCLIAVCMILCIGAAGAYNTPESIAAAGKVYVSSVTYDPEAFYTGDTGTVTFTLANGNADHGIVINHASYIDPTKGFTLTSGSYDNSANIGPNKSQQFIFSVKADGTDGTYYPMFSISFRDADNLWQKTMVKIDNTPLVLTVIDKPDAFTQGRKKTINVQVANPRNNGVKNVMLEVSGKGALVTPEKIYVGNLASGANKTVNFAVTPDEQTTLSIVMTYNNGDNIHTVTTDLPITFGTDKKGAHPVISNVQVKTESDTFHVTGDVTNAGLETANSVTVSSLAPAVPQDPYRSYVVGALKPDDFGSFEVTFLAENTTSVPLLLSFKDADGNIIESRYTVDVPSFYNVKGSSGYADSQQGGSLPVIPIAVAIAVILVFAGGWYFYLKRNKQ